MYPLNVMQSLFAQTTESPSVITQHDGIILNFIITSWMSIILEKVPKFCTILCSVLNLPPDQDFITANNPLVPPTWFLTKLPTFQTVASLNEFLLYFWWPPISLCLEFWSISWWDGSNDNIVIFCKASCLAGEIPGWFTSGWKEQPLSENHGSRSPVSSYLHVESFWEEKFSSVKGPGHVELANEKIKGRYISSLQISCDIREGVDLF